MSELSSESRDPGAVSPLDLTQTAATPEPLSRAASGLLVAAGLLGSYWFMAQVIVPIAERWMTCVPGAVECVLAAYRSMAPVHLY